MKRPLLTVIALAACMLLFVNESLASHYMGGEITWECTAQGNFRFVLKVYRECAGIDYGATTMLQTNVSGFPSITMNRISVTDMSPVCSCPGGPNLICSTHGGISNTGRVQEHVFTSDGSYPNGVPLTGIPPSTGWYFAYTNCCRNPCSNIVNASSLSWHVRAWMFPYQNANVSTCYDNSPRFNERPSTVLCTGFPYQYHHMASDPDSDSLAYSWDTPLNAGINTPITNYSPGYSFNSPLPGPWQNPNNVAATIDSVTGIISFTSYTNGAFVTVTKVTSYKNGVKVAEVFREMQVVLLSCGLNNPPLVTTSVVPLPANPNHLVDTVIAGQSINLPIAFFDLDQCNDTLMQSVYFTAAGDMLDSLINPGGCANPPCAGFSPSPTPGNPLFLLMGGQTMFQWNTSFMHLKMGQGGEWLPATYHFYLKVWDNFCPAPAIRNILLTIILVPPFDKSQPEIRCVNVIPNGDVTLRWTPPVAPSGWVSGYTIEHSGSVSGPFVTIGNLTNASATSFTHTGAGANLSDAFYRVNAQYTQPVAGLVAPSFIASSIKLSAQVTTPALKNILLTWQPTLTNLSAGYTGVYEVYRESSPGQWTLFKTLSGLTCTDTATYQGQTLRYKVLTANTHHDPVLGITSCTSTSNIASVYLSPVEEMDSQENEIRVFPNPGNGLFTLMPGSLYGFSSLSVFDLQGKLVFSGNPVLASGEPLELDMRILTPGTYFLNIECGEKCFATRIMIE